MCYGLLCDIPRVGHAGPLAVFCVLSVMASGIEGNIPAGPSFELSHPAEYKGEIMLAAFIPIHKNGIRTGSTLTCGEIQEQDGIEFVEALFYALDAVNEQNLVPGVSLGAFVFDTCTNELHALEQAVELLRFLMSRGSESVAYECNDGSEPVMREDVERFHRVVGTLGAAASGVSLYLASLLRLFEVPQISHLSTSSELSNAERFPFFWRTVPSDTNQAMAIVKVLKEFNWTYVSVIYDDSSYGTKGFGDLSRIADEEGICFGLTQDIDFDDPNWSSESYDRIVDQLFDDEVANVVVVYTAQTQARRLFEAVQRRGSERKLVFVGSDAWSGRLTITSGLEDVLDMCIAVQPLAYTLPQFDDYFTALNPRDNKRNPWFNEFWERRFNCTMPPTIPSPDTRSSDVDDKLTINATIVQSSIPFCTGNEVISEETGYVQLTTLHFMYDAVLAYGHALAAIHADRCGTDQSCPPLNAANITGAEMKRYLQNVQFTAASGLPFSFVNQTDGPPRYSVKNFRRIDNQYQWKRVGTFSGMVGEEEFDFDDDFRDLMSTYPASSCREECKLGQIRERASGNACCWRCSNCSTYDIIARSGDLETCENCVSGTQPNDQKDLCVEIPETYVDYTEPWSLGALAFSAVGVVCVTIVFAVFIAFFNTPVIKASGRELSLLQLGGILLSYLSTVVLVAPPSPAVCGLTRILVGLCYTICYAAILTKTNRIARIFTETTQVSPRKTKYTSPRSQIVITSMMVLAELVVIAVWLAATPPRVAFIYPTRDLNVRVCEGSQDARFLIPLIFPFLLLIACVVYAFKTRKTPDGFNETRFIGFTTYTTCVIWLGVTPLYYVTANVVVSSFIICVSLSLSATVSLACMFIPKIYICLLRPMKNTREAIMARTSSHNSASAILEQVGVRLGSNTTNEGLTPDMRPRSRSFMNLATSGNSGMKASPSISSLPVSSFRAGQRQSQQQAARVTSVHGANPTYATTSNTPPSARKSPKHFARKDLNLNDIRLHARPDTREPSTPHPLAVHDSMESIPDATANGQTVDSDRSKSKNMPSTRLSFKLDNSNRIEESHID